MIVSRTCQNGFYICQSIRYAFIIPLTFLTTDSLFQGGRCGGGRRGCLQSHPRIGEKSARAVQKSAARDAGGGRGRRAGSARVPAPVPTSPLELFPRVQRSGLRPRGGSG